MKRYLSALVVGLGLVLAPYLNADPPEPAKSDPKTESPAELRNEAAVREKVIAESYRRLESKLLELAQRLEKSSNKEDREKAASLRQALDIAGRSGVNTRFEKLIAILKDSRNANITEIKEAIEMGERLAKDLEEMIKLISKDGELAGIKELEKRLAELIRTLEAIIRAEKVARVHTEKRSVEQPMIAKAQDKITADTSKFAKDMEDKNQPGHDRLPGKELVKQAIGDEQSASGNIAADKNDAAAENQTAAIDKLTKVRDALDKLLKQIREEERKAILASLQARIELLLQMQIEVYEGTQAVDKAIAGNSDKKPSRADIQKALELSAREEVIVAETDKAIALIREQGTALAFLEVFQQVRQDMASVQRRLGKTDVGRLTQTIEKDIIDTLTEMLGAVKRAQEPPPPPSNNPNDTPQPPSDNAELLNKLAELKMIRSMQMKLNQRTVEYGKQYEGEEPKDTDIRKEIRGLSERQANIQRVTQDLYTQKNK